MPEFTISLIGFANFTATVDAADESEAFDKAVELAPTLCHQCAGWGQKWELDLGDEWLTDEEYEDHVLMLAAGIQSRRNAREGITELAATIRAECKDPWHSMQEQPVRRCPSCGMEP